MYFFKKPITEDKLEKGECSRAETEEARDCSVQRIRQLEGVEADIELEPQ